MDNNLREKVLQQVRAEIISGHSAPGTMYSVPSLATSLWGLDHPCSRGFA